MTNRIVGASLLEHLPKTHPQIPARSRRPWTGRCRRTGPSTTSWSPRLSRRSRRQPPRFPKTCPEPDQRAWQAQLRLYHRHRHLTRQGKPSTVVNIAVARELCVFLWAAVTDQPLRLE